LFPKLWMKRFIMVSLKEKYKKPEPFMKWLRKTRNEISRKTHNMTTEELIAYYKKGAEECKESLKEVRENDKYFGIIIDDYVICRVLVLYKRKFDSFQWVWDHQEEVYNATRDKNWNELVDYFESIYQYIQNN